MLLIPRHTQGIHTPEVPKDVGSIVLRVCGLNRDFMECALSLVKIDSVPSNVYWPMEGPLAYLPAGHDKLNGTLNMIAPLDVVTIPGILDKCKAS